MRPVSIADPFRAARRPVAVALVLALVTLTPLVPALGNACGLGLALAGTCAGDARAWVMEQDAAPVRERFDPLALSTDGARVFALSKGGSGFVLGAFDAATGARAWESTGPGTPVSVEAAPDGARVFVLSKVGVNHFRSAWSTTAYDAATGRTLWSVQYDKGKDPGIDDPRALAVAPDGRRVFVTGESRPDFTTVAYDAATGRAVWEARTRFSRLYVTAGADNVVSPAGSVVFAVGDDGGPIVHAYDAATGSRKWSARYGGDADGLRVVASPDGASVLLVGTHAGGQYALARFDADTGRRAWAFPLGGEHAVRAHAATVDADGARMYVTGTVADPVVGPVAEVVAVSVRDGALEWWARLPESVPVGYRESATDVATSPDGGVIYVAGATLTDLVVGAFDAATGERLWVLRHAGDTEYYADLPGLEVHPAGSRLHLSGWTGDHLTGVGGSNHQIVAYDLVDAARSIVTG